MHLADLADIVEELSPEDRQALISAIDREVAADTLSEVAPEIQVSIFEALEPEKAAEILEEIAARGGGRARRTARGTVGRIAG